MVLIACFEIKSIKFCYLSHFSCIADGASSDNVHDQKMILFGQSINAEPGGQPCRASNRLTPGGWLSLSFHGSDTKKVILFPDRSHVPDTFIRTLTT